MTILKLEFKSFTFYLKILEKAHRNKFSPNLERIGLMVFYVLENDPREAVEEKKKKTYEEEFELAKK